MQDIRTDTELVEAANKGDEAAFEAIYLRYRDWVCSIAYRFCGDRDGALDVLQETFFYFFNKFPGFVLQARLKTFLYPVVKHQALKRLRGRERTTSLDRAEETVASPPVRDHEIESRDLAERVRMLPETQREVVMLRYADDLSMLEIADALEIPTGTVKSRLHTALTALRQVLQRKTEKE